MIPSVLSDDLSLDFEIVKHPSKTWRISFDGKPSAGMVTGIDAIKQTIHMILHAERFKWSILSHNYGVELEKCFGEPDTVLVQAMLSDSIKEALMQDERINSVEVVSFDKKKNIVTVSFDVSTIVGTVEESLEVVI